MFWTGNFKLKFFLKGLLKPPKHRIFAFFPSDVNFPDLSGFWEIPKDSKVIPIYVRNSQELGKIPASSHTGCKVSLRETMARLNKKEPPSEKTLP